MQDRLVVRSGVRWGSWVRHTVDLSVRFAQRRWMQCAAFATVAVAGSGYLLAAPAVLTNDNTLRSASTLQPDSAAANPGPASQASQPESSETPGATAKSDSSTDVQVNVSSSSSTGSGSQTVVTINGKRTVLPQNGAMAQSITTDNGHTSISVSNGSSTTGFTSHSSSLDVDMQSDSSGG